jgi:hypothetical protein
MCRAHIVNSEFLVNMCKKRKPLLVDVKTHLDKNHQTSFANACGLWNNESLMLIYYYTMIPWLDVNYGKLSWRLGRDPTLVVSVSYKNYNWDPRSHTAVEHTCSRWINVAALNQLLHPDIDNYIAIGRIRWVAMK